MTEWNQDGMTRRTFVRSVAGVASAFAIAGCARGASQSASSLGSSAAGSHSLEDWAGRLGLQLFTVRDQIEKDFEGTLAQVAAAGYREVEPTTYANLSPAQVRAVLDRVGLSAPSTHVALMAGPELERQLAGYQQMGHRWAMARAGGGPPGGGRGGPPPGAAAAPGQAGRGTGARPAPPPQTLDSIKRQADVYNVIGAAGKPYGVKVLIHNHTGEFQPLDDGMTLPYDVLFQNTDPALVAFELDIGWAMVAGQDPMALFAKHPGRFPLWHVKDMADLKTVTAMPTQGERQRTARIVPVGLGDINYRPVFEHASEAGLEHYYIEQDTAPDTGSIAAMRLSAQNLRRALL